MSRRGSGAGLARRPHADTGDHGTPLTLFGPHLIHWYRADDSGITLNGAGVASLPNRGGLTGAQTAIVQATALSQPTFSATSFNGLPGITGGATNRNLKHNVTSARGAAQYSFWLVAKTALASGGTIILSIASGSTNSITVTHPSATGGATINVNADLVGGSESITGPAQDTNRHLISYRMIPSTTAKMRVDDNAYNGTRTTGTSASINGISLLASITGTAGADETIAELVVVRKAASDADELAMRRYFLYHPTCVGYGLSYTP